MFYNLIIHVRFRIIFNLVVAVKQGVHERMALHDPYNTPQVSLAREIFSKDGLVSIRQMFKASQVYKILLI